MKPWCGVLPAGRREAGVSLIEIMVGLIIGLLASLTVMRSFSASENFRRNVSGSADAIQTSALVGARLGMLVEDAGAGLVQGRHVWGCRVKATRDGSVLLPAARLPDPFSRFPGTVRVMPLGILDGGDGSDVLLIISGGSASGNRDIPFTSDGRVLIVNNPNGIGLMQPAAKSDDLLLAVRQDPAGDPDDCQIVQAAAGAGGGEALLDTALGLRVMPSQGQLSNSAAYATIPLNLATTSYGAPVVPEGSQSSAFHLGREAASVFSLVTVNANAELVEYDLLQRRGLQAFGENIVLIKARYGLDNGQGGEANDNVIDQWVSPSDKGWTLGEIMNGRAASEQKIDQIKAIRVGLVVRSSQVISEDLRVSRITLFDDLEGTGKVVWALSADEQRFGYQVFDWVIHLRNMKLIPKS